MARSYRALSLDLWDTVLFDTAERQGRRNEAQILVLANSITRRGGNPIDPGQIMSAREEVWQRWRSLGLSRASEPVFRLVEGVRDCLGGRLVDSIDQVVERYSAAGLAEFPPEVNPEARAVITQLEQRGVRTVIVSNTTRRGRSWVAHLRERERMPVLDVISSCDVGAAKPDRRIFQAACATLSRSPAEVLHVGDILDADVRGGIAAGMGAALYTGLWSKYVEVEPGMGVLPEKGSEVQVVADLSQVLPMMDIGGSA